MNILRKTPGLALLTALLLANAQAQTPAPAHTTHPAAGATAANTMQMQQELTKLREQVRVLEQRAASQASMASGSAMPAAAPPMPGMKRGEMAMAGGMGMGMGMKSAGTAAMPMPTPTPAAPMVGGAMAMEDDMPMPAAAAAMPAAGGGMDMMQMMQMMQMMMGKGGMMSSMGGMNSPTAMATPSAEPGLPGQSHLYHIGATGFFLDHPEHITLTTGQQQMLALHKEQALLKRSEQQGQIDAAEQQLWLLTGADQPQAATIDTKAREIERLRGDQRIAFVKAVRESAQILSNEQRMQLTGLAPAQPIPTAQPMPAAMPAPMPMPMEDDM